MKPGFEDMLVFLAVVDARSFTAAAERLGRTKSSLSQAVTRLESELGFRLLFRTTRSLSLTESGAKVYAHSQDIKEAYDSAIEDLNCNIQSPSGTLSITAPHALCSSIVATAVATFLNSFPQMDVRIIADDSHTDLVNSQVDLALRVGTPQGQATKISKLGMLSESLYASPSYIEIHGGVPSSLKGLSEWTHIANEWQSNPIIYSNTKGSEELRIHPKVRCNALPDILRLVEEGVGVAQLPDITAQPGVERGELVPLFLVSSTPIYYMHLFSKRAPVKVRKFIEILRQQLKDHKTLVT